MWEIALPNSPQIDVRGLVENVGLLCLPVSTTAVVFLGSEMIHPFAVQ